MILDEEKRNSAAKSLEKSDLFSTWIKEDLLGRIGEINKQLKPRSDIKEVNLVWKGVLFFIVNRVLCADQLRYYEDLFVALEMLTSISKDGHLRRLELQTMKDQPE